MSDYPRLAALICVLIWSIVAVVAKSAQSSLDFYQFLFFSNVMSLLSLLVAARFAGRRYAAIFRPGRSALLRLSILGLLDCLFYLAIYRGYARSNGVAVLVAQYSWPLIIVLLSAIRDAEWPGLIRSLGLAMGVCAIILTVTRGHPLAVTVADPTAILIVLGGAFCFALMSTLSKSFVTDPYVGSFWLFLVSTVVSGVFMGAASHMPRWEDVNLTAIILNGVLINGVSYILWMVACARGNPSEIASLVFLSPVLSAGWLVLLYGEKFVPAYAMALLLVLGSGLLCMMPRSRDRLRAQRCEATDLGLL